MPPTPDKRKALGRGLEALLPSRPAPEPVHLRAAETDGGGQPLEIPVGAIERNPFQTRTRFDEALLAELTASVAATGVIQPIVVRPLEEGRYQLITGERRLLAGADLRLAGGRFLRKGRYMDRARIEVVNGIQERSALRLMGCVIEVANYVPRVFVPVGAQAVMNAVLSRHPVEEVLDTRAAA